MALPPKTSPADGPELGARCPWWPPWLPMMAALDYRQGTGSRSRPIRGEHATPGMKSLEINCSGS
eukprot:3622874-Pyramimonas_sp.AAC.1